MKTYEVTVRVEHLEAHLVDAPNRKEADKKVRERVLRMGASSTSIRGSYIRELQGAVSRPIFPRT